MPLPEIMKKGYRHLIYCAVILAVIAVILNGFYNGNEEAQYAQSGKEEGNASTGSEQEQPAIPDETEIAGENNPANEKLLPSSKLLSWTGESKPIVEGISSCTIIKDGEYWMYYTAKGIELAKSSDGVNFTFVGTAIDIKDSKEGLDMVSNPSVFATKEGKYRMIYEGSKREDNRNNRRLYSAISSDGLAWAQEEGVRFQDEGDGKAGELFTSVPEIIRLDDGRLRMYYTRGITSAIAISNDDGITWTKEKNLDFGRIALDIDIARLDDGTYKLFFTSFDSEFGKGEQYMMSASSIDGVNFALDEGKRISPSGGSSMILDPDTVKTPDGIYRMYYGKSSNGYSFKIHSSTSTN